MWWSVTVTGGPYRSVTRDGRPFVVADDSGRATIKPFDARTVISTDSVHKCRGIRPEPVHEPFLRELDRLDGTYRNGREPTRPYRFRFEEAVIVAGARLMVTGLGMRELEVHDQTDYRSAAARLLITGTVDHPVHLIDEL